MTDIRTSIAAGLERSFARHGFAAPSVDDLRKGAGVSLRTLYKYAPSREAMVRMALEHRHRRYLAALFDELPAAPAAALAAILDRVATWMGQEAAHGCLFHAAVAAAPEDRDLRDLLAGHKAEVARRAAAAAALPGREGELMLILEGLTQSWPLRGAAALDSARRLAATLPRAA